MIFDNVFRNFVQLVFILVVECIAENQILRRIASHCVEDTQGLFISLPEDDLAYQKKFIESCNDAGIKAEAIAPTLA